MQSGELIVTGTSQVYLPLKKFPSEVHVKFKHDLDVAPCNPLDVDELEWEVIEKRSGVALHIKWSVSGVREVVWHAYY